MQKLACLPYGAYAEIKRAGALCRRLTEGASEVARDARPLTATALSSVECNVRLRASYRGCIRPHPSSIRSLCTTDYKISPAQRKYLNRIVVRGEQMSAAQTIALKARSQETGKTAPRAARSRRLSARPLLLAGAAIVAFAGASDYGWYYWTTSRFEVSTDDAYVKADSTIIAPKVGGYLSEVLVRDNQPVKATQLLAKIDDRDYVVALAQARADVAAAQGEIENISATIDHQQAVIAQADGTVAVDKATLRFAEQDYARYKDLASRGAGIVQNAQQATSKRDAATATLARDG